MKAIKPLCTSLIIEALSAPKAMQLFQKIFFAVKSTLNVYPDMYNRPDMHNQLRLTMTLSTYGSLHYPY